MNTDEFLSELRDGLVAAADRTYATAPRPRRRLELPHLVSAAAALLVICVAAVFVVADPTEVSAHVEVTERDGAIEVRLTDTDDLHTDGHDPADIEAAVAAFGVDVDVVEVPVGESMVGQFVHPADAVTARGVSFLDAFAAGDTIVAPAFRVSGGDGGRLQMLLGRSAATGEAYHVLVDATSAGEVLACQAVLGETVAAVADRLDTVGATGRWYAFNGDRPKDITGDLDSYSTWRVVQVQGAAPGEVIVEVTDDGRWPHPHLAPPTPGRGC